VASDVIKRTARAENRPVDAGGSVSVVGGAGGKLLEDARPAVLAPRERGVSPIANERHGR